MESRDNYQIIISNLKKLLVKLNKNSFTLLDVYADNDYLLGDLINSFGEPLTELAVFGKADADFPGPKKAFNSEEWSEEIAAKFKNAVVIINKVTQNEADFMKMAENLSEYFPLMFVISSDTYNSNDDWRVKKSKEVNMFINCKIKSFTTFNVANFNRIRNIKVKALNSEDYSYQRQPEEEIEIVLEAPEEPPVTRQRPNQLNLSIFDNLPSPTMTPDGESQAFMQEFYSYLKDLISRILPEDKMGLMPYLLNRKTLKEVWLRAFTSKLVKPDYNDNYEPLETIGDKLQEYAFFIYCMQRFPEAKDSDLTNLKTGTLKSENQSPIGEAMKLSEWAIIPKELRSNIKIKEDLFESFTGALDTILNKKSSSYGQASNIIYYFFQQVFDDYDFAVEFGGADRNFVEQLVEQIRDFKPKSEKTFVFKKPNDISSETWKQILDYGNKVLQEEGIETPLSIHGNKVNKGIEMISERNKEGQHIRKIVVNEYGSKVFKKRKINIPANTVIGEAVDATTRPAENKAWLAARKYLSKKGINEEWRDKIKMDKFKDNLGPDKLMRALAKAKKINPNIVDITVINPESLKRDHFFQVIGIDKNNRKQVLYTLVSDNILQNNFQIALDDFLKS